jgi:hypothetical protein
MLPPLLTSTTALRDRLPRVKDDAARLSLARIIRSPRRNRHLAEAPMLDMANDNGFTMPTRIGLRGDR